MRFDELFEQRSLVASKLKECIRDKGYTKVSFAGKAEISRPTLDRLLNGAIDNKSTFDRHLQKIQENQQCSTRFAFLIRGIHRAHNAHRSR